MPQPVSVYVGPIAVMLNNRPFCDDYFVNMR